MSSPAQKDADNLRSHLESLTTSARYLAGSGQTEQAEKLYQQIAQAAPHHIESLNYLAQRALERKDFKSSEVLLQKAIESNPSSATLFENLGLVHLALDRKDAALQSFNQALKVNPGSVIAAVNRALLLEQLGRHTDALAWSAETCRLLGGNFWTMANSPQAHDSLKQSLKQAYELLMTELTLRLDKVMNEMRAHKRDMDFNQLESALQILTRRRERTDAESLQRPSLFYYPGIRTKAFYEREAFPWLKELEAGIDDIREELNSLLDNPAQFKPYVSVPAGQDPQQWRDLNRSTRWNAFHLYKNGTRLQENCTACPKTTKLMEDLVPLARIQNQAPEIFFSVLNPGTHIPPHHGLANYKLALHIPLKLTTDCAIRVGHETRTWEPDRCLIFDDSFQHEAWNNSSQPRIVLIADIWHPDLTQAERQGIIAAMQVLHAFKEEFGIIPTF